MKRLLFEIRFDGAPFRGWQVQGALPTVQGTLNRAFENLLGKPHNICGCGRTDSGVHANRYFFHTDMEAPENFGDPSNICAALSRHIPKQISIIHAQIVDNGFHARYNIYSKEYLYLLLNSPVRDPFLEGRAYLWKAPLDEERLSRLAGAFVGRHDFSAFCAAGSDITDRTRTIYGFKVLREGNLVRLIISGNGFLYNMARIMCGTLLQAYRDGRDAAYIEGIIAGGDRSRAGVTLPPHGLYLNDVVYKDLITDDVY